MMIFPYVMLQTLQAAGRGVQPLPIGVHPQPSQQQVVAYNPNLVEVKLEPSQQQVLAYNPLVYIPSPASSSSWRTTPALWCTTPA